MRSNTAVTLLVNSETGVRQIIDFLEFGLDEEVQANCAKIIRIALREDYVSFFFNRNRVTLFSALREGCQRKQ
jgi:hypothetical protein